MRSDDIRWKAGLLLVLLLIVSATANPAKGAKVRKAPAAQVVTYIWGLGKVINGCPNLEQYRFCQKAAQKMGKGFCRPARPTSKSYTWKPVIADEMMGNTTMAPPVFTYEGKLIVLQPLWRNRERMMPEMMTNATHPSAFHMNSEGEDQGGDYDEDYREADGEMLDTRSSSSPMNSTMDKKNPYEL